MPHIFSADSLAGRAGEDLGVSDWVQVDEGGIDRFAPGMRHDQFIQGHLMAAAQTVFGGTLADGMLTRCKAIAMLLPGYLLVRCLVMAVNYGFKKVRLITPVRSGSEILAWHRFKGATQRVSGWRVSNENAVKIRGMEKPALTAEPLILQLTA